MVFHGEVSARDYNCFVLFFFIVYCLLFILFSLALVVTFPVAQSD